MPSYLTLPNTSLLHLSGLGNALDYENIVDQDQPVYPCPKTAITCKRHKGFLYPQVADNDAHGVRDTLIARAIFSEWTNIEDTTKDQAAKEKTIQAFIKALEDTKKCKECGEPADRY